MDLIVKVFVGLFAVVIVAFVAAAVWPKCDCSDVAPAGIRWEPVEESVVE